MPYEIILKGRVQGVCCRMYCSQAGRSCGVHGAATNLRNGDVQVLVDIKNPEKAMAFANLLKENTLGLNFYGNIIEYDLREWGGALDGDYTW